MAHFFESLLRLFATIGRCLRCMTLLPWNFRNVLKFLMSGRETTQLFFFVMAPDFRVERPRRTALAVDQPWHVYNVVKPRGHTCTIYYFKSCLPARYRRVQTSLRVAEKVFFFHSIEYITVA